MQDYWPLVVDTATLAADNRGQTPIFSTAFGYAFPEAFWLLALGSPRMNQPSGETGQANCPATQPDDQAHWKL